MGDEVYILSISKSSRLSMTMCIMKRPQDEATLERRRPMKTCDLGLFRLLTRAAFV